MRKIVLVGIVAAILTISLIAGIFTFQQQSSPKTMQNIFIRANGSVYPSDAPIQVNGNFYSLTDSIYGTIKIQKSNIILDGQGFTLSGPYNGSQANVWVVGDGPDQSPDLVAEYIIGIDFAQDIGGVTIQNFNIRNFSIGMYVWTENNTVSGSSVSDNIVGILLSGQNNLIKQNYIEGNKQGLFMGFNNEGNTTIPPDISIHHNDFENNDVQLNGCNCLGLNSTEPPHNWDDGSEGNYWSDYTDADVNKDGIGDTPYVVDALNIDRYPLMESPYHGYLEELRPQFNFAVFGLALAVLGLFTWAVVMVLRKRRK